MYSSTIEEFYYYNNNFNQYPVLMYSQNNNSIIDDDDDNDQDSDNTHSSINSQLCMDILLDSDKVNGIEKISTVRSCDVDAVFNVFENWKIQYSPKFDINSDEDNSSSESDVLIGNNFETVPTIRRKPRPKQRSSFAKDSDNFYQCRLQQPHLSINKKKYSVENIPKKTKVRLIWTDPLIETSTSHHSHLSVAPRLPRRPQISTINICNHQVSQELKQNIGSNFDCSKRFVLPRNPRSFKCGVINLTNTNNVIKDHERINARKSLGRKSMAQDSLSLSSDSSTEMTTSSSGWTRSYSLDFDLTTTPISVDEVIKKESKEDRSNNDSSSSSSSSSESESKTISSGVMPTLETDLPHRKSINLTSGDKPTPLPDKESQVHFDKVPSLAEEKTELPVPKKRSSEQVVPITPDPPVSSESSSSESSEKSESSSSAVVKPTIVDILTPSNPSSKDSVVQNNVSPFIPSSLTTEESQGQNKIKTSPSLKDPVSDSPSTSSKNKSSIQNVIDKPPVSIQSKHTVSKDNEKGESESSITSVTEEKSNDKKPTEDSISVPNVDTSSQPPVDTVDKISDPVLSQMSSSNHASSEDVKDESGSLHSVISEKEKSQTSSSNKNSNPPNDNLLTKTTLGAINQTDEPLSSPTLTKSLDIQEKPPAPVLVKNMHPAKFNTLDKVSKKPPVQNIPNKPTVDSRKNDGFRSKPTVDSRKNDGFRSPPKSKYAPQKYRLSSIKQASNKSPVEILQTKTSSKHLSRRRTYSAPVLLHKSKKNTVSNPNKSSRDHMVNIRMKVYPPHVTKAVDEKIPNYRMMQHSGSWRSLCKPKFKYKFSSKPLSFLFGLQVPKSFPELFLQPFIMTLYYRQMMIDLATNLTDLSSDDLYGFWDRRIYAIEQSTFTRIDLVTTDFNHIRTGSPYMVRIIGDDQKRIWKSLAEIDASMPTIMSRAVFFDRMTADGSTCWPEKENFIYRKQWARFSNRMPNILGLNNIYLKPKINVPELDVTALQSEDTRRMLSKLRSDTMSSAPNISVSIECSKGKIKNTLPLPPTKKHLTSSSSNSNTLSKLNSIGNVSTSPIKKSTILIHTPSASGTSTLSQIKKVSDFSSPNSGKKIPIEKSIPPQESTDSQNESLDVSKSDIEKFSNLNSNEASSADNNNAQSPSICVSSDKISEETENSFSINGFHKTDDALLCNQNELVPIILETNQHNNSISVLNDNVISQINFKVEHQEANDLLSIKNRGTVENRLKIYDKSSDINRSDKLFHSSKMGVKVKCLKLLYTWSSGWFFRMSNVRKGPRFLSNRLLRLEKRYNIHFSSVTLHPHPTIEFQEVIHVKVFYQNHVSIIQVCKSIARYCKTVSPL